MKKVIWGMCLTLILCTVSCASPVGSSNIPPAPVTHTITEIDGVYYLNFSNGNEPGDGHYSTLKYDSLQDMKNQLLSGQMDSTAKIKKFLQNVQGKGLKILNVNDLYVPCLPANYQYEPEVAFFGTVYNLQFEAQDASGINGTFIYYGYKEEHDIAWDSSYEWAIPMPVISEEYDEDRNATVYIQESWKTVEYEIQSGSYVFPVLERYRLSDSADVPEEVWINCEQAGKYFRYQFRNLPERPTVEWLLSFGIKPYVEDAAA